MASFGDALVIAQSGAVRLRIVRDRSQIFLDLGSAAEPATAATKEQLIGLQRARAEKLWGRS